MDEIDGAPIYRYNNIKPNLRTGDIILFSCNKIGSLSERIMYGLRTKTFDSIYGHAGLVFKKDDNIYIIECCGQDQCGNESAQKLNKCGEGGIRIIEIDTLLQEYYKEYNGTYAVKFISKELPNHLVIKNLKKYKNIIFQEGYKTAFLAIMDEGFSHRIAKYYGEKFSRKKMTCTEFLYNLLYDCGIVKEYPAKLFWPHLIAKTFFTNLELVKYSGLFKFSIADPTDNNKNNNN